MGLKTNAAAAVAALSLVTAPAMAQDAPAEPKTAPGQLCQTFSKKKTSQGKGKSPFAACVVGVNRARKDLEEVADGEQAKKSNPTTLCKGLSKKKAATDEKTPFAACVSGAARAQREAKKLEREAEKAEREQQQQS